MSINKRPQIVVSGIQPTGRLHLGNYVGAVANWLKLQDDPNYRCWFFIADWHSLTGEFQPDEKREQIFNLAADLLALGLDPNKCRLFVQSEVLEHTELCWIFNTVTPISFLERMTQYKDKSANQQANINMGLFDYPVLQAADILIYKGERVPVGRDQVQHVELTRDIARFFNNKFGDFFPEATPLLTDTPKLMSLSDPLKKMSKSLGTKSYVALTDEPDEIYAKIKTSVTETTGIVPMTEIEMAEKLTAVGRSSEHDQELRGYAGVFNLLTMLKLFGQPGEADRVLAGQPIKYGELKRLVATRIAEHFAGFRERRAKLVKSPSRVWAAYDAGAKAARTEAKKNMREVRQKIGLR